MQRIRIPGTDLLASTLCYGMAEFGTRVSGADADRLIATFLDAGGNFFDSAHIYAAWRPDGGAGASERELGAALRRLGVEDDVVVATKGGHPAESFYPRPDAFLAPEVIARDIDESLERLGRSTIDLFYLHRDDPRVPADEIVDALNREIERGRIRAIGASNWSVARLAEAKAFAISQVQWSLAAPNWRPAETGPTVRSVSETDADWYAANAMPVAAYTATAGGYFASDDAGRAFDSPINAARRERARELAATLGRTPNQIAVAYLRCQPFPVFPIFGTTSAAYLNDVLGAAEVSLTPDQIRWLRDG